MRHYWAKITSSIGYTIAAAIIIFATLVNMTGLLDPYFNERKAEFESWAAILIKAPVSIGHVSIYWNVFEPEIDFDHVAILDKENQKPLIDIQKIKVNLQVIRSLLHRTPISEEIQIVGVHFRLHQLKDDQLKIEGLGNFQLSDTLTGASVQSKEILNWLFSIPRLVLREIDISYFPHQGTEKSITLDRVSLQNNRIRHIMRGHIRLNQAFSTKMNMTLAWYGDPLDIENISANLELDLKNVSLPQVLNNYSWHDLKIKDGIANAKIIANWNKNQLQNTQTYFQIQQLEWDSQKKHNAQYIARLEGRVDWKRNETNQVLSGENIIIELSHHLWPTTAFSVTYTPDEKEGYTIHSVNTQYVDLGEIKKILLNNKLLSDNFTAELKMLDPTGEIRGLHAVSHDSWSDFDKLTISSEFSNLTFHEWKKFPGVKNLNGSLTWNGKNGALILKNAESGFSYSSFFPEPLRFDQFAANINFQKEENNAWILNAKNIWAMNSDIKTQTDLELILPANDSPTLNLTSEFNVPRAAHLVKYLPLKLFEPDLVIWLKNAFRAGTLEKGKAVFQGQLKNFPFENKTGKFEVSSTVKNLDLNFAPKWPSLRHLNGQLKFLERSLLMDVNSAEIFSIPVKKINASIVHLGGKEPVVLNLDSQLQTDFTQAMKFIQESPLKNTLGKDLEDLNVSGPIELKLGLIVPLKKPDATQVSGVINFSNTTLNLPAWNLMMDKLQGTLQFTENEIRSNQINGRLFDAPVLLALSTQYTNQNTSYLQAIVQGTIQIPVIQKWLKFPAISDYVQGSTDYKAEVRLASHNSNQPNELVITSDLKGVSVNLPDPYKKNLHDALDFKLQAFLAPNQPLKIKMDYGKLLSAAVVLKSQLDQWQLVNAELKLGTGAAWQTQPGILVTGKIDKLDWEQIKKYIPEKSETTTPPPIRAIDVTIGSLALYGQTFKNVEIQLEKAKNTWHLGLQQENINGEIFFPFNTSQPIEANFDRFYLKTTSSAITESLDPRKLPVIIFSGNDVRINEKNFGSVKFYLSRNKNGLTIDNLSMDSSVLNFNAKGEWLSQNNAVSTRLQGEASTKKVSDVLTAWGFDSSNFVGGKGNVTFDLSWPDAPYRPTEKGLTGNLSLKLGEGRIVDIGESEAKMGFGRLLSILSLQTIPKRLSFNFSDLTQKGYSFDSLKGDFNFAGGNAFTENTHFAGSVADIKISGRIGLEAKDFDMVLAVTPHLTSSLPLVATAISGPAAPIAGVATWAVDRLVTSRMITYHYQVKGPWNNPQWSEVEGR